MIFSLAKPINPMLLFFAFLIWSWCVVGVLACVMVGHFKDHESNRPDDKDES